MALGAINSKARPFSREELQTTVVTQPSGTWRATSQPTDPGGGGLESNSRRRGRRGEERWEGKTAGRQVQDAWDFTLRLLTLLCPDATSARGGVSKGDKGGGGHTDAFLKGGDLFPLAQITARSRRRRKRIMQGLGVCQKNARVGDLRGGGWGCL